MSTPQYSRLNSSTDSTMASQFLTNDLETLNSGGGGWWASTRQYYRKMNKKTRFWLMLMALVLVWLFVIYLVNSALNETHDAHMENTKNGMEVKVPAHMKHADKLHFQVGTHLKDGQKNSIHVHDQMHHASGALKPVHHVFDTRVVHKTFSIVQRVCHGHFKNGRCDGTLTKKMTKFIPLEKTSEATIARHQLGIQVTRKNIHFQVNGKQVAFHRIEAKPINVTRLSFHGKWLMQKPRWLIRMKASDYLQRLNKLRQKMVNNMHKHEIAAPKQVSENDAHKKGESNAHEKNDTPGKVDAHEKQEMKPVQDKQ